MHRNIPSKILYSHSHYNTISLWDQPETQNLPAVAAFIYFLLFSFFRCFITDRNTYTNAEQETFCCIFFVNKITIHMIFRFRLTSRYFFSSMRGLFTPKLPSNFKSVWILTNADPEIVRRISLIFTQVYVCLFSEPRFVPIILEDTANVYEGFTHAA